MAFSSMIFPSYKPPWPGVSQQQASSSLRLLDMAGVHTILGRLVPPGQEHEHPGISAVRPMLSNKNNNHHQHHHHLRHHHVIRTHVFWQILKLIWLWVNFRLPQIGCQIREIPPNLWVASQFVPASPNQTPKARQIPCIACHKSNTSQPWMSPLPSCSYARMTCLEENETLQLYETWKRMSTSWQLIQRNCYTHTNPEKIEKWHPKNYFPMGFRANLQRPSICVSRHHYPPAIKPRQWKSPGWFSPLIFCGMVTHWKWP